MARPASSLEDEVLRNTPRSSRLLLAVSGGVDSIALLHACVSTQPILRTHLEVAHVDHGLRPTSGTDAAFVESLSRKLGLRYHGKVLERRAPGVNLESWARNERYAFFGAVMLQGELQWIVTAHHANDVAETLLMRLVSNKEPGEIARFDERRKIIRPLLSVPRSEIERYAREEGLEWVEDETNRDTALLRNRVRHELIPHLERHFDLRIIETLSTRAQALADDAAALDAWSKAENERLASLDFGSREWLAAVCSILRALEPGVQWRFIRDLLLQRLGYPLGRLHAGRVVEFFLSGVPGVELPEGVSLRRSNGGLIMQSPGLL